MYETWGLILVMPIRIRIGINVEIRLRIGIKTMPIYNTGMFNPGSRIIWKLLPIWR